MNFKLKTIDIPFSKNYGMAIIIKNNNFTQTFKISEGENVFNYNNVIINAKIYKDD